MSGTRRLLRLAVTAAFLAAATVGPPSQPASASTPQHVAVVVDGIATACVTWHSGMSGGDVLSEGGFNPQYGQRTPYIGFVLQLSGQPAAPDPSQKYWAYFHLSGSSWLYSGDGALGYHPLAGTVDGWALSDTTAGPGGANKPPVHSYASICAGQDPAPAPTHSPRPRPTHTSTGRTAQPPVNALPPGPATTSTHANPTASATARPTPRTAASPTGSTAAHVGSSGTPVSAANALPAAPPKARDTKRAGVPAWSTALAIVLVAALGGLAFWRARSQRQKLP